MICAGPHWLEGRGHPAHRHASLAHSFLPARLRRFALSRLHVLPRTLASKPAFRVEDLAHDFVAMRRVINRRRRASLPSLRGELKKEQLGPKQQTSSESRSAGESPSEQDAHVAKYVACGAGCVQGVNQYYRRDFEVVKYPVLDVG